MKFKTVLFLIFSSSGSLFGQECDCHKNITLLQQTIEDNQASYQHQVIEQNRLNEYLLFRKTINSEAKTITTKKGCIGLISLYLSFFRDEHSFISYESNYAPKPNSILKPNRKKDYKSLPFEGLWYFHDGSFSIDIFQSNNASRAFVGVIKDVDLKTWSKGQVKMEIIHHGNGKLTCIYWAMNLIPKAYTIDFTDSTMIIGRNLLFYRRLQTEQKKTINTSDFHFRQLSERTNYLKLPSFDLSFKNKIDSLIATNRIEILSKKNLIIDVRNNGGGGFDAFQSILPYVMDTNLVEPPFYGSVWVSKGNYDFYNRTKYEYTESKQDSIDELSYVTYLEKNLNHFTPIEKDIDTIVLEENAPVNIAIIQNKGTASTAEGFILQLSKSKKVKTFGENSKGAVTYGDWRPVQLPELHIWVAITTKKMIFRNNEDFESIGISPEIDLKYANENEWLKITLEQIER